MPDSLANRISFIKRLIAWGFAILVLYGMTMVFVMLFSLASAYEKFQTLTENGSVAQVVDPVKLKSLEEDARRAASAAGDLTVIAAEYIPWLGSDVHAARVLSIGLGETLQALTPLVEQRDAISLSKADLPKTLKALSGSMDSLDTAIQNFDTNLESVNPTDLHFGLEPKVTSLKKAIQAVSLAVHEGAPLLKTAAVILNQPGETTWFVATQNASELRASGGLLGSYAILGVKDGKLSLKDFGADSKLLARGPLNVNFESGVDNIWGGDLTDWRDLNVSSHIPDNGQIILDAWRQKFGKKLDGVIFFSQGTVAHLVGAAGGAEVSKQKLDQTNTVDFLTKEIYAKFPDVKKKNAVVASLMGKLFGKLTQNDVNLVGLFESLANPTNVDNLYLYSTNRDAQLEIEKLGIDGSVPTAPGSHVIVDINNGGGNKIDAYLKTEYTYSLNKCGVKTWDDLSGREATVTITLTNNAPKKGLPKYVNPRLDLRPGQKYVPSSNREVVTVYAPVGATDERFTIDGEEDGATFALYRNRPVYVLSVELNPGQTRTVEVSFIEPVVDSSGKNIQQEPTLRAQRTLDGTTSSVKFQNFCPVG